MLLGYYGLLSLFFIFAASELTVSPHLNTTFQFNNSQISGDEQDTGGIFGSGVSFSRFLMFVGIGYGIDAPLFFQLIFSTWQIIINIFALGFFISAIWNG